MEQSRLEFDEELRRLRIRQTELSVALADEDLVLHDHERLQREVREESRNLQQLLQENGELLERRTQHNFDVTIQLDQILREQVSALFLQEHQHAAAVQLETKAGRARMDNQSLLDQCAASSKEGLALSRREKRLAARVAALRIEESVDAQALEILRNKVARMRVRVQGLRGVAGGEAEEEQGEEREEQAVAGGDEAAYEAYRRREIHRVKTAALARMGRLCSEALRIANTRNSSSIHALAARGILADDS